MEQQESVRRGFAPGLLRGIVPAGFRVLVQAVGNQRYLFSSVVIRASAMKSGLTAGLWLWQWNALEY